MYFWGFEINPPVTAEAAVSPVAEGDTKDVLHSASLPSEEIAVAAVRK